MVNNNKINNMGVNMGIINSHLIIRIMLRLLSHNLIMEMDINDINKYYKYKINYIVL